MGVSPKQHELSRTVSWKEMFHTGSANCSPNPSGTHNQAYRLNVVDLVISEKLEHPTHPGHISTFNFKRLIMLAEGWNTLVVEYTGI